MTHVIRPDRRVALAMTLHRIVRELTGPETSYIHPTNHQFRLNVLTGNFYLYAMWEILQSYALSPANRAIFLCCALLIGMSKTGLPGAGLMVVPMMAGIFGGRESVGIVLRMLIIADVFAIKYL
jgi:hypothetical protein